MIAASGCCCCLLLLAAAAAGCCCCWLAGWLVLLLAAAAGCCCCCWWLPLLAAAAAAAAAYWLLPAGLSTPQETAGAGGAGLSAARTPQPHEPAGDCTDDVDPLENLLRPCDLTKYGSCDPYLGPEQLEPTPDTLQRSHIAALRAKATAILATWLGALLKPARRVSDHEPSSIV